MNHIDQVHQTNPIAPHITCKLLASNLVGLLEVIFGQMVVEGLDGIHKGVLLAPGCLGLLENQLWPWIISDKASARGKPSGKVLNHGLEI